MAAANAVLREPIISDHSTRLDLNSPPPSTIIASSNTSSSSSNSPSRSEISSSMSAATAAAAAVATPKKAGGGSPAEAEAIKQQLAATTFIQADVMNFREVVQKHTGAAEDAQDKMPVTVPARQAGGSKQQQQQQQQNGGSSAAAQAENSKADPPPAAPPRRHSYKLHERKQKNIHNLDIVRQTVSPFKRPGCSPRGGEAGSSPKLLYDPLLVSPVTPLSGEAFETSNPPPLPLTPTEQLRQSFAASLHCCEDASNAGLSTSNAGSAIRVAPGFANGHHGGGVLDRFPFLQSHHHHGHGVHNVVVHQQQQQQQQNGNHHHGHVLSPVLGNHQHHILQQNHHQNHQQQQQHFVEQPQIHRNREPELLDLFPVHSPRLKETQGSSSR